MTQATTKRLLPVMTAWAEGKVIQCKTAQAGSTWTDVDPEEGDPPFHYYGMEWRVKPTPIRIAVIMSSNGEPLRIYHSNDVVTVMEKIMVFEQVIDGRPDAVSVDPISQQGGIV